MITKKRMKKLATLVEYHFQSHGIPVKLKLYGILKADQRLIFQIIPMPGTKVDSIFGRTADVQAAMQIPLFQPFNDGIRIYLAVSAKSVRETSLRKTLGRPEFRNSTAALPLALGYDLMGRMVVDDLKKMYHAMYVGVMGSGKSIGLICLIMSLICKHPVSDVNLVIFDIGADSLDVLANVPHLSCPIVKDRHTGIHVLHALADEMERRNNLPYSQRLALPTIVCVIDEYVSFLDGIKDKQLRAKVVDDISKLLRRGRKEKIHFVLATQNPKNQAMVADVENITSRMAFKVARFQTSVSILNCGGAEKLPGNGAFLYQSEANTKPIYVQGAYISDDEATQLVERIKAVAQDCGNKFVIPDAVVSDSPTFFDATSDTSQIECEDAREFASIILWALGHEEMSVEKIKSKFHMGKRAYRIIDKLFEAGLVSEKFANQPRKVLPQSVEDIPDAIMKLLTRYGVTIEEVADALNKRNPLADRGEEDSHDC